MQNASYYEACVERGGQNAFYEPQAFQPVEHIFTQRITSAQIMLKLFYVPTSVAEIACPASGTNTKIVHASCSVLTVFGAFS